MPDQLERPAAHLPPLSDPVEAWMIEVTAAMERLSARMAAVEKSLDQNTSVVSSAAATSVAAVAALTRIAKVEEDRLQWEKETTMERASRERDDRKSRDVWMTRLWSSQPIQLLAVGIVMALLNFLGLQYFTARVMVVPNAPTAPSAQGPLP